MGKTLLFVGIPTRGSIATGTFTATHRMDRAPVHCLRTYSTSLLTLCFNNLWCAALNERQHGITDFVMLHDDIAPLEDGWLDTLVEERRRIGADILSCVVPIKDERGYTSTAFLERQSNRMRRLTMTEACKLPATFDARMAGYPECSLLPNTGLWICDFTKPWVEKICFTIRDKIFQGPDGAWLTQCFSEDWDFGVQAAELGLKVAATTAVKLTHRGGFDYPNFAPWGTAKEDDARGIWEKRAVNRPIPEPIYDRDESEDHRSNRTLQVA